MKIYKLTRKQIIHAQLDQVWDFFSSPENLDALTPQDMGFEITSQKPLDPMHRGQLIDYVVSPILKLPLKWRTEIIEVVPKEKFIDYQLKGPYKLWRHTHYFKPTEDGIEMIDEVEYSLPLGILGRFVHFIFVKSKLENIFDYRYRKVEETFNS